LYAWKRSSGPRRGTFTVPDAFFESSGGEELPTSNLEDPGPRATERFPSDFDYQLLYFDVHLYGRVEGGEIYTANETREFYVITDERTIRERAGFRDDDRQPITIRVFDAAAERDAYCVASLDTERGAEE
jgi:hypothetical protein